MSGLGFNVVWGIGFKIKGLGLGRKPDIQFWVWGFSPRLSKLQKLFQQAKGKCWPSLGSGLRV